MAPTRAKRLRADLLATHLQARLSGARLRQRVEEIVKASNGQPASATESGEIDDLQEDLEDFDPHDPTHLFFDEIRRLGFALKEIRPEDLTDDLLEEYLRASEPLWSVLAKIEKRRHPRAREVMKI